MKNFAWLLASFVLATNAFGFDLATIGGHPNMRLDFAQDAVKGAISYTPDSFASVDFGTKLYSILSRRGVDNALSLQILLPNGASNVDLSARALLKGARSAKVVLYSFGPKTYGLCDLMSHAKDTVFVVNAELHPPYNCKAANIINVAGLDAELKSVPVRGWDPHALADVAAPATNISVIGVDGRYQTVSDLNAALAFVAAKVSALGKETADLQGAALATKFYETATVVEAGLNGVVESSRRLDDSGN